MNKNTLTLSIKRALLSLLMAAKLTKNWPRLLHPLFKAMSLLVIKLYRITLSPLVGNDCIFSKTCSHQVEEIIKENPWHIAIEKSYNHVNRCNGNYSLFLSSDGKVTMRTSDGTVYHNKDISKAILTKFQKTKAQRTAL